MIAAYLAAMRRYADFSGRVPRSEYWWFHISLMILLFAALGVDSIISEDPESATVPLTGLVLIAHVLPSLAASVRRLHDVDRSGWFALVSLIPVVGPIVLIVWYCERGTTGANRFGPTPLRTPVVAPALGGHPLATAARDVVAEIERLAGLRASGTLSETEFETLKAQIVAGYARA